MSETVYRGRIVDVVSRRIFPGRLHITGDRITEVVEDILVEEEEYLLPGLIDAHIHIESSMLVPSAFARMAVVHGTTAVVSDPHEIANVLGAEGVRFMIENGKKVPMRFYFGAPSCVPATGFETSGARLGVEETEDLLKLEEVKYLAEMMNFPGVIYDDPEVHAKLALARKYNKPIDGHAPGLRGSGLAKYAAAGISTDHECFTPDEALEKIALGMKIQIREGSAARNFDTLIHLLSESPDQIMLCSDDKHPDDLVKGHINLLIKKALGLGYDIIDTLRAATLVPTYHYGLEPALLQKGHKADFIVVNNLSEFKVLKTFIDGQCVALNGLACFNEVAELPRNRFNARRVDADDFVVKNLHKPLNIIKAIDGEIVTGKLLADARSDGDEILCDIERDYLKIAVINRYQDSVPGLGLIQGFGLKRGAIASTVAHDSHNIIAIGADSQSIAAAVNALIDSGGGIAALDGDTVKLLPLPFAGLMTNRPAQEVAAAYEEIDQQAKQMGCPLAAPFMTLSFMALLVIPSLKISDKGLFDGDSFRFTSLFADENEQR